MLNYYRLRIMIAAIMIATMTRATTMPTIIPESEAEK